MKASAGMDASIETIHGTSPLIETFDRPQRAQIGSRAFTLPASPPGTKETFPFPAKVSAFDAEGDIPQPGADRLSSANTHRSAWWLRRHCRIDIPINAFRNRAVYGHGFIEIVLELREKDGSSLTPKALPAWLILNSNYYLS